MTMYEDTFFSLTDYQNSPGEILFFPKNEARLSEVEDKDENLREPEVWQRGDYELLSQPELSRCVEIFVLAREKARGILQEEISHIHNKIRDAADPAQAQIETDDLFTKK